jgi:hypothetical protein
MPGLPYELTEAMVQCFGTCFYYKDAVASFMSAAGVDHSLIEKHRGEAKFVWARRVIAELAETEQGVVVQHRLLTEMCRLRDLPDAGAVGLDNLRRLKGLAQERDLVATEAKQRTSQRREAAERRPEVQRRRSEKLSQLLGRFAEAAANADRQRAGYDLEIVLAELFELSGIEYRTPYRTDTQQMDGSCVLDGVHYLVEARWRSAPPSEADVAAFKHKVDSKLSGTRGLLVTVLPVRPEVLAKFEGHGASIVFADGADLAYLLEGRVDLADGLRYKLRKASEEGRLFVPLVERQ